MSIMPANRPSAARRGRAMAFPVLLGALALSPLAANRLNPYDYDRGDFADQSLIQERNSNAFAVIMGEFRTNLSDLMFIKTERYLHGGIAYAPHLNMDLMAQSGEIEDKAAKASTTKHWTEAAIEGPPDPHADAHSPYDGDDHEQCELDHDHDHDHANCGHDHSSDHDPNYDPDEEGGSHAGGAATVIPDEVTDFRGWIGHIHRQVKPWQDPSLPHIHASGEELLPWYRVMTLSNPKNTRAYLIGSWWLKTKRDPKILEEALSFLEEGIRNNPSGYQLHLMRGYILRQMEREAEALAAFKSGAELVAVNRPPNGTENPRWTEYQEDDARGVARMAVFLERRIGDPAEALRMARRYNDLFGGDGRLEVNIAELEAERGS